MKLQDTTNVLVSAEVLSTQSIAAGYPLWLPFGSRVAERLDTVYLEELARRTDYLELEPPLLVSEEEYGSAISGSFDYKNMYALEFPGGNMLVRPDNLFAAARTLAASPSHLPVVMQGSLYRSETGSLRPLVRDQHIWRTTQVVHWLGEANAEAAFAQHLEVLWSFLSRLALPTVYVESPPLRSHSQRRLLSFSCSDASELTLTSTLYLLAQPLVRKLGLAGNLIDFGFTAKLLALSSAVHSDRTGLVLPSALAPEVAIVGCKAASDREAAERIATELRPVLGRVSVIESSWHRTLRTHRRRGTPLLVLADADSGHQFIQRVDDSSIPLPHDLGRAAREAVERHDRILAERALEVMRHAVTERLEVQIQSAPEEGWHLLGALRSSGFDRPGDITHESPGLFSRRKRLH